MKRILISAVLALALAGTSAFAAQNKNTGKKPAAKSSNTATMTKNTGGGKTKGKHKRHRKAHRKSTGKAKNKNM